MVEPSQEDYKAIAVVLGEISKILNCDHSWGSQEITLYDHWIVEIDENIGFGEVTVYEFTRHGAAGHYEPVLNVYLSDPNYLIKIKVEIDRIMSEPRFGRAMSDEEDK